MSVLFNNTVLYEHAIVTQRRTVTMASRASIIREHRRLVNSLQSEDSTTVTPGDVKWWNWKKEGVEGILRLNPLRIGIANDETVETIQSQLLRGDRYPEARIKCWKHIAIELSSIPGCGDYDNILNDDSSVGLIEVVIV